MPVYEYQCQACHQEFEYQQRMSDPDKTTCEVCGGSLDRLISRTAFQLKGSGWYKDLYSSKPAAGSGKAESGTEASGSADKSASGDKGAAPAGEASSGASSSGTSSAGSASSSVAAAKAT